MNIVLVSQAGLVIFSFLATIYFLQIAWLALRRGRIFLPIHARLVRWIARRIQGDAIVNQREQQFQVWAKPFGCFAVAGALLMLSILIRATLRLIQLF